MAEFIKKSNSIKIDQIQKPIRYLDNGNAIVTVCASSDEIDTDGEVLDLDSFKGEKTMVVSAYHNLCGGTPVNTGAKITKVYKEEAIDDKGKSVKMMFFEIEVKPTDEVRYCDYGSLERKSNGNLLQEIEKGILSFVSMGFTIGKRIKQQGYTLLKDCIGIEISFLDVRPANIYANVFKTMDKIKTKCFCGNAKEGRLVTDIATATEVLKLKTQISQDKWVALRGDEEVEVTAEDYELIRTPEEARAHFMEEMEIEEAEKACSCQKKPKNETKDEVDAEAEEANELGEENKLEDETPKDETPKAEVIEADAKIAELEAKIAELENQLKESAKKFALFEARFTKSLSYLDDKIIKSNNALKASFKGEKVSIVIPSILK